jgi:hypothetical protein
MVLCESCQVREEAAISGSHRVPQTRLLGNCRLSKGVVYVIGGMDAFSVISVRAAGAVR